MTTGMALWSRRELLAGGATAALVALGGCSTEVPAGDTYRDATDWPMHAHDTTNRNANPASTGPESDPEVAWTAELLDERRYGHVYPSPVVVDGAVYTGGDGLYVHSLADGDLQDQILEETPTFGPAVVEETVFVATRPGEESLVCKALDVASLEEQWSTSAAFEWPRTRPLVVDGEHVYASIGHGNGIQAAPASHELVALDVDSGTVEWSTALQSGRQSPPPAVRDGVVYNEGAERGYPQAIGTDCGIWCRFGSNAPDRNWRSDTFVFSSLAPVVDGDTVYFTDRDIGPVERGGTPAHLTALDASNGSLLWQNQLGFHVTSPAIVDGTAYVGTMRFNGDEDGLGYGTDVTMYAYQDGEQLWETSLPDRRVFGSAVTAGELCYLGTLPSQVTDDPAQVHAFERNTGDLRWTIDVPTEPCSLAVTDGVLVTSGWSGTLVAIQ